MLQLHLLHTIKSPNSTLTTQDKDILSDITFSFHDLGVLTKWKRRMKESDNDAGSLPWHLAALDTMEIALVDFFSQL
jgi:mediator of RNA polymerase II transcription subunit 13